MSFKFINGDAKILRVY